MYWYLLGLQDSLRSVAGLPTLSIATTKRRYINVASEATADEKEDALATLQDAWTELTEKVQQEFEKNGFSSSKFNSDCTSACSTKVN